MKTDTHPVPENPRHQNDAAVATTATVVVKQAEQRKQALWRKERRRRQVVLIRRKNKLVQLEKERRRKGTIRNIYAETHPIRWHCFLRTPNLQWPQVSYKHRKSQRLRSAIRSCESALVRQNRAFSSSQSEQGTTATNCSRIMLLTLHHPRTRPAIHVMRSKGVAGPDDTPPTFLKALGPMAKAEILSIFNESISKGMVPGIWKAAPILPLKTAGGHTLLPTSQPHFLCWSDKGENGVQ